MPTPHIQPMLDLSTEHVPPDQCARLSYMDGVIAYELAEYGYLIWVPPTDEDAETRDWRRSVVPEEVQRMIDYADSLGCEWIKLDRDGTVDPALPTYAWQ